MGVCALYYYNGYEKGWMLASAAATLRDGEPPVPDGAKVVFYATVESEVRSLLLKQETIMKC
jgi:hypothetical protein